MPDFINSVGLGFDIIGVILLFRYGLAPDIRRTGERRLIVSGGSEIENRKAEAKWNHYRRMSWIGLSCLVGGFVLQILSNYL